jgi:tetratricopeptide (TPR) repeat protein
MSKYRKAQCKPEPPRPSATIIWIVSAIVLVIVIIIAVYWQPDDTTSELPPAPKHTLAERGMSLLTEKRDQEALDIFKQVLAQNPDDTAARLGMGIYENRKGNDKAAEAHFQFVISHQPDNALAHYNLGTVYKNQQRLAEAIEERRTADRIELGRSFYRSGLCSSLEAAEDYEELYLSSKDWHERKPSNPKAKRFLALAALKLDKYAEAAPLWQDVTAVDKDASSHFWLALCQENLNDSPAALVSLEHAFKLDPYLVEGRQLLVEVYNSLGRTEDAQRAQKAAEKNRALVVAVKQAHQLIEDNPESAKGPYKMGMALLQNGYPKEALGYFQRTLVLSPTHEAAARAIKNLEIKEKPNGG